MNNSLYINDYIINYVNVNSIFSLISNILLIFFGLFLLIWFFESVFYFLINIIKTVLFTLILTTIVLFILDDSKLISRNDIIYYSYKFISNLSYITNLFLEKFYLFIYCAINYFYLILKNFLK